METRSARYKLALKTRDVNTMPISDKKTNQTPEGLGKKASTSTKRPTAKKTKNTQVPKSKTAPKGSKGKASAAMSKPEPSTTRPKPSAACSKPRSSAACSKPKPSTAGAKAPDVQPIHKSTIQHTNNPSSSSYVEADIECQICCNFVPIDYMVQCIEGHLFCCECLKNYAHEAVYGGGMSHLECMLENCDASFPRSQLVRALPDDLMKRYEEKIREEEVNSAGLKGFVKCSCGYGAVLDPEFKYFLCGQCVDYICRDCGVRFKDHNGPECSKVEKDGETKIRKGYEEKMSEAKIRTCSKCNAKFTKEDGCNKIICKCGTKICYVCRKIIKDYNHFCQHLRLPGKDCQSCNACNLWSNADEDDVMLIKELKRVAEDERNSQGFVDHKQVGVPEEFLKKHPGPRVRHAVPRQHPYRRPVVFAIVEPLLQYLL